MLVCLYTPRVKKEALECINVVECIKIISSALASAENESAKNRFLTSYSYFIIDKSKEENKYDTKKMENLAELYAISHADGKDLDKKGKERIEVLVHLQQNFQDNHNKLQSTLERMVQLKTMRRGFI